MTSDVSKTMACSSGPRALSSATWVTYADGTLNGRGVPPETNRVRKQRQKT